MHNFLRLSGSITQEEPLRYTPAGVAILQVWLTHHSEQQQAGGTRKTDCVIQAVLTGQDAKKFTGQLIDKQIEAEGFLAKRSFLNPRLVFHIQQFKLI
ncbi:MAG: primosomal replication protein N [Neisseriales bacterium]|nr:MAG: primosomal replication protein N [Neisseriales bacterium]